MLNRRYCSLLCIDPPCREGNTDELQSDSPSFGLRETNLGYIFSLTTCTHPTLPPEQSSMHASKTSSVVSTRGRNLALLAAFLGWMFDGMEMGIFPLVAGPGLREMGVHSGLELNTPEMNSYVSFWMGWVTAFFLFGAALGGLTFGWLGDRIGRIRAMSWSILCYSAFTGLCYFAAEPWQMAALRFIAALGMGGEWALGVALVMESWPSKWRSYLAGLIGAAANLGYVLIALIAIYFPVRDDSWRWVMLIGAAPAILTFGIRMFVPESHLWEEAQQKGPSTPIRDVLSAPILPKTLLATLFASVALIVTWGIVQWIPLWADQIALDKNPIRKAELQLCSSSGAVFGSLIAPIIGNIIGRRLTYFGMCGLALILCETLFLMVHDFGIGFKIMTIAVGASSASFYGWLPLYLPELFPTRARATGQGLAFNFGRIFAGIGALFMPQIMKAFEGSYPKAGATIALMYLVGMIAIWFAPETKDKPLPD